MEFLATVPGAAGEPPSDPDPKLAQSGPAQNANACGPPLQIAV